MSENKTRMMIKNARLAFPDIFEPKAQIGNDGKPGKPRYSAVLIIPPDHPQIKQIKAAILAAAELKWPGKGEQMVMAFKKQDKLALHDGDSKPDYDGFEGNLFISAAAQVDSRPTVVDADRSQLNANDGRIYAGCYVNASVDFWGQDNQWGKRINAQLRGVQFYRDGDAFSAGRPADSDEFEDVSEGSDAGDFGSEEEPDLF